MNKSKILLLATISLVTSNAFAQACNCEVTPQADGSFNVNCKESTTVVLLINQPKVIQTGPIGTTPTIPKMTPVPTKPATPAQETELQKQVRELRAKYAHDPSVYIDDNGKMHFK